MDYSCQAPNDCTQNKQECIPLNNCTREYQDVNSMFLSKQQYDATNVRRTLTENNPSHATSQYMRQHPKLNKLQNNKNQSNKQSKLMPQSQMNNEITNKVTHVDKQMSTKEPDIKNGKKAKKEFSYLSGGVVTESSRGLMTSVTTSSHKVSIENTNESLFYQKMFTCEPFENCIIEKSREIRNSMVQSKEATERDTVLSLHNAVTEKHVGINDKHASMRQSRDESIENLNKNLMYQKMFICEPFENCVIETSQGIRNSIESRKSGKATEKETGCSLHNTLTKKNESINDMKQNRNESMENLNESLLYQKMFICEPFENCIIEKSREIRNSILQESRKNKETIGRDTVLGLHNRVTETHESINDKNVCMRQSRNESIENLNEDLVYQKMFICEPFENCIIETSQGIRNSIQKSGKSGEATEKETVCSSNNTLRKKNESTNDKDVPMRQSRNESIDNLNESLLYQKIFICEPFESCIIENSQEIRNSIEESRKSRESMGRDSVLSLHNTVTKKNGSENSKDLSMKQNRNEKVSRGTLSNIPYELTSSYNKNLYYQNLLYSCQPVCDTYKTKCTPINECIVENKLHLKSDENFMSGSIMGLYGSDCRPQIRGSVATETRSDLPIEESNKNSKDVETE